MKFFTFFIAAMATATSVAAVAIPYANRAEHHPDMLQKRSNSIDMISLDSNSPQGTVHLERRQGYSDKANAKTRKKIEKTNGSQTVVKQDDEGGKDDDDGKDGADDKDDKDDKGDKE
ncbi:hypothetical protein BASA50_011084 [Batrachochytrium salamandrivorans]|uniref:Uncharacterized protein n=1 Tax=Batrachochytrium salamandrivorans TaxID=1357716 RepID=A0ABQ8EX96_9FUNG|nr:hypothetical protein BASA50_011084 [Batrachochytrium salamandrivorans]